MNFDSNRRVFGRTLLGSVALGTRTRLRALGGQGDSRFDQAGLQYPTTKSLSGSKTRSLASSSIGGSIPCRRGLLHAELGKVDWNQWFTKNPYAEWYLNTLRIENSPTYQHHAKTYGTNFDYYKFAEVFAERVQKWDPNTWAALFKKTGARYVVLTTKHHDGFTLWPSRVKNPNRPGVSISRDLVGDVATAVRDQGMKMGLYYSGGLDWTFTDEPIRNMGDLMKRVPQSEEYASYADAHWRELIERYKPAILWNDISYPKAGKLQAIFSDYYNTVPDGVINNRFGVPFSDFTTPEYAKYDKITEKKWESCRGLGFSFGYNQLEGPEQVIAPEKLIALLVDIVSKNGNLLLNIGPRPDGSISDIQLDRLQRLGEWLAINGEGLFESEPWTMPAAKTPEGAEIRFTRKKGSLYAFFLDRPKNSELVLPEVVARRRHASQCSWPEWPGTLEAKGARPGASCGRRPAGPVRGQAHACPDRENALTLDAYDAVTVARNEAIPHPDNSCCPSRVLAGTEIQFNRDVRPILSDRCYACHGPDKGNRKTRMRLDIEADAKAELGKGRFAIVPGSPEKSELYKRIVSTKPTERMPPAYLGHDRLPDAQIAILKKWLEEGAKYQQHWSFLPPVKSDPPAVIDSNWARNEIDRFILARLEKEGLKPSPEADRRALIRRLSLDLGGLPPTPAEVDAFLRDSSPAAYEKIVDRLLASNHYAERMAVRWLDAARYADTNGYQSDGPRIMWPWRDWVIDAFRRDMPFDQFTVEQIAGDLLPNATQSQRIATAFHRNHRTSAEGGIVDEEFRVEYVADRAETTSTVWLGLTVGCARCHDHKFDPITQKDYYSLFAFFNNVPERGFVWNFGNEQPVIKAPTPDEQKQLEILDGRVTIGKTGV